MLNGGTGVEHSGSASRGRICRRGGEVLIFEWGKAEKGRTKGKLLLTKLLLPRHQVTLSQIPPSQKEMWGTESKPHFPACPHANSSCTSVACEPAGG
jgi:hypothetical protein